MNVGFLLFPKLTQLDLTGPYEVLARAPGAKLHLIWKYPDPVESDRGLHLTPPPPSPIVRSWTSCASRAGRGRST